jgi:tight adherence protein B
MNILIGIGIFILTLILIEGGYYLLKRIKNPEKREVLRRLRGFSSTRYENEIIDIMRKSLLSEVPWLNQVLLGLRWTDKLNRLLEQADTQYTLGVFVLLSILMASAGFVIGSWLAPRLIIPLALFLGMMPFLYIYFKKKRRMEKFQRQLPEALDLIARALKAGHPFTGGLRMVADELGDPIGTEFEKILNEINFGVGIAEALKNLAHRVECPNLKFFIVSVVIQRETGGNLAEILAKIAALIRERFNLQNRVQVLSAEGKLSAIILITIPFFIALALSIINPGYIKTLIIDPVGKRLVGFAFIMMIIGIFVMKRMIQIKV